MAHRIAGYVALLATAMLPETARAGLILSQAVVDIAPQSPVAQDIEVWNDGTDVGYVVVEPSEVQSPGLPAEHRVPVADPAVGGMLVTPQRLILQPGERKLIRIAAVAPRMSADRIYRITIKPVAGPVTASATALKLLVGYDVLVIYRPDVPMLKVSGERSGTSLTLRNEGNTNVEIYQGTQCDAVQTTTCKPLPARRLYAGATWKQDLPGTGPVQYHITDGAGSSVQHF